MTELLEAFKTAPYREIVFLGLTFLAWIAVVWLSYLLIKAKKEIKRQNGEILRLSKQFVDKNNSTNT